MKAKTSGKLKYEDAPYHHQQSQGIKSPAPKNTHEVLKDSIMFSEDSKHRIGVDFENKGFNYFFLTSYNEAGVMNFQGHVRA